MTMAAYAPALRYGFVYEDLNDPATLFGLSVWDVLGSIPKMPFRVIPRTVWALCLLVGHGAPTPYHIVSLLVHLLNGGLLYVLLGGWAGVVAAGVWWLHPLQVESVAYISSLPDAMAATGILAALALSRRWPWAAWFGIVFAVMSKESAVMAYALIPLWMIYTDNPPSRAWWTVWGGFGLASLVMAFWGLGGSALLGGWVYTMTQVALVGQYLSLVLVPVGLTIDHDYASATPLIGLLVTLAALALLRWSLSRFLVLWIALSFLPRLLFGYGDGMHEHHWSIAMIGIAIICGHLIAQPIARPAFVETR